MEQDNSDFAYLLASDPKVTLSYFDNQILITPQPHQQIPITYKIPDNYGKEFPLATEEDDDYQ